VTDVDSAVAPQPVALGLRSALLIGLALTGLIVLAGWFRFGSLTAALDAFTGVRLLIDSDSRDLGQVAITESKSLEFHLFNRSGSPVTILGGRVSCNCLQPDPFPFTLQPGESRVFGVRFRPKPKPGPVSETLTLFTDDPRRPAIRIQLTASVAD
jgi:hypothetical protein